MGDKESKPSTSLNVDVGASARLEVKTEVPAKSAGRLVDALTDALRPFTEARGLRADQIRLQREEVLIEVARLAAQRRRIEDDGPIEAVPASVLVPLLEKASLQDFDDDEALERWAELLSSASRPGSIPPRMVSLLADLSSEQAKFLETFLFHDEAGEWPSVGAAIEEPFDGVTADIDAQSMAYLVRACSECAAPREVFFPSVMRAFSGRGLMLESLTMDPDPEQSRRPWVSRDLGDEKAHLNAEILSSLYLLEKKSLSGVVGGWRATVTFFQVTALGVAFLRQYSRRAREALAQEEAMRRERHGGRHAAPDK